MTANRTYHRLYREKNAARLKAQRARHYIENRDRIRRAQAKYRNENTERLRAFDRARAGTPERLLSGKKYYARNKDVRRESERLRRKKSVGKKRQYDAKYRAEKADHLKAVKTAYYLANKSKFYARVQERNTRELKATPIWVNRFFIEEAFDLALRRSALKTGGIAKWDVDHIVPLRSPLVCGLHVENNLRVIPAKENRSKGNRFWPDMP